MCNTQDRLCPLQAPHSNNCYRWTEVDHRLGLCPTFISANVRKYPDKKQLWGERVYFSQFQVIVCYFREIKARTQSSQSHHNPSQEQGEISVFNLLCSLLHSSEPSLGHGGCRPHSGRGFPTSFNPIKNMDILTGHPHLDNPFLRLSFQMTPDCVQLTTETNLPMLPFTQHLCVKYTCRLFSVFSQHPAVFLMFIPILRFLVIPTVLLDLRIPSLSIKLGHACHLALFLLIPLYTVLKHSQAQQDSYYHCPHLAVKKQRNIRLKYLVPNLGKPRVRGRLQF